MHAVTTAAIATANLRESTIRPEFRALADSEIEAATGGTLEIGLGPLTLQINADSGCFAVWWGKEYVGGACKK
jgi:hypothetical protein